ncbi:septation ring formation regulator EzrA [Ectobacillus ponti]|uniref:Septation ring formation regulator EzrA n=1 Tax=Ectobacillus ponti TaxID=2961894 RepID=A0AA42BN13_9BACI|nr:septation ring formation regulator EzrA [Ectobacillus ponti]MCP8967465.1 septation ring formation regulator EzrA [Ectobacillus ponti]
MNSLLTIVLIVVGTILLLLIAQLIMRSRLHKQVKNMQRWKQEIAGQPVADELTKVKELQMTGQTEELFEKWRQEWDELLNTVMPAADEKLRSAEVCVSQFSFGKGRMAMEEADYALRGAEDRINSILDELKQLLESRKKNSSEIEELRTAYRDLKRNVLAHRHTFSLAEQRLDQLLDEQSRRFQLFDEATMQGNYLEAREIVLALEESMSYLYQVIQEVPDLQVECQVNLPSQLDELQQGYGEMQQQGYVLEHLDFQEDIQLLQDELQECLGEIRELQIGAAHERLEQLKLRMDRLYDQLELEVKSKHYVEKQVIVLHDTLEDIRHGAAETREETQFVKQSYQLSDKDVEMQKYIEKQLGVLIKRYDILQLRIAEQDVAFSVIREEIDEISRQMNRVNEAHQQYKDMLQTLRREELQAREALQSMRQAIKELKRVLQKSNIPGLPAAFVQNLQMAQEAMQRVYEQLEFKPLNMTAVNTTLEEALRLVGEIQRETDMLVARVALAEKCIQYGNRYRSQNQQVAASMERAEQLFRQYEYQAALEQAAATLESLEPGVVRKIEEFTSMD